MFIFVFGVMIVLYFCIGKVVYESSKSENKKKSNNDKRYATINSHYSPETLKHKQEVPKNIQVTNKKPIDTTSAKDVVSTIIKIDMESASHRIKDDSNDWLSAQIDDEKRAYKKACAMFDFDLAADHHKRCDAGGVDTGVAK